MTLPELLAALPVADAVRRLIDIAYEEDLGPGGRPGDVTTRCSIDDTRQARGLFLPREAAVISGLDVLEQVRERFAPDCQLTCYSTDGGFPCSQRALLARIDGPMRQVLAAERTMLNLLGRMSGIATRTARFARAIAGTGAQLFDTRKTTPGWRALEKYAVRCGGGYCHRIGLHDAVLFKDNHIVGVAPRDLPAWLRVASERARALAGAEGGTIQFIELEVDTLEQLEPVLASRDCGVDMILLDNMDCDTMRRAVEMRTRHRSRVEFEASGGITLDTIRAVAETGVERISVGGLTHHAVSIDVWMDIEIPGQGVRCGLPEDWIRP